MKNYQEVMEKLQGFIDDHHICGAYVKIREGGELALDQGVGVLDPEASPVRPVREDTIFRLASMTKPLTATAALMLCEEGKLSLEDPLTRYLPMYVGMGREEIQIRHLLNHSCGLGMIGMPGMIESLVLTEREDVLSDRVLRWKDLAPDFPAGTQTGYSPSVGFDILGRIIEIVSGEDLSSFMKKRIFQPLGMKDTTFLLSEEQKARLGALYHDESYVSPVPIPADFGEKMNYAADAEVAGYFSGGAGLYGTAADYDRFALMLLREGCYDGGRLLKAETLRLMRTPSNDLQPSPDVRWGLGVQVFGKAEKTGLMVPEGSFGWSGAYGTHFYANVESGLSVVLMLNADGLGGSQSYVSRAVEEAVAKA